jgi:membrane fusion protein, multidrug efflux system
VKRIRALCTSSRFHWIAVPALIAGLAITMGMRNLSSEASTASPTGASAQSGTTQSQSSSQQQAPRRVGVAQVTTGVGRSTTTYPGTTKASQTANLAFRVGGPLIAVDIKPGDQVSQGDVLMRIDPRDFEVTVSAAKAALDSARSKLASMKNGARKEDILALEAQMDAAVANRDTLQKHYERCTNMVKVNAVSQQEMDNADSRLKAAAAEIRALQQELEKARAGARVEDIQAMEADIRGMETALKSAEDALQDSWLRAPFDGMVTKQLVENYEQIASGRTVVGMHDISTIEIDVDLPEKEIIHRPMQEAFSATVRFLSIPDRDFEAVFKEIDTEADPSTRTYRVTFSMKNPDDINLLPGMVAEISIESRASAATAKQSPMIPALALRSDETGHRFVWVVDGESTARRRTVRVGRLSQSNLYEILDGVAQGERIVTAGAAFLHDGQNVVVADHGDSTSQ